jgi:hypothetical protein
VKQGYFNVPSGGVSSGGKLHAFFWTNHCMSWRSLSSDARRVACHVLHAFVFKRNGRRIHASTGLELPQALAVRRAQGGETPVVPAYENQASRSRAAAAPPLTVVINWAAG